MSYDVADIADAQIARQNEVADAEPVPVNWCPECRGTGIIRNRAHREYDLGYKECKSCRGKGRVDDTLEVAARRVRDAQAAYIEAREALEAIQ